MKKWVIIVTLFVLTGCSIHPTQASSSAHHLKKKVTDNSTQPVINTSDKAPKSSPGKQGVPSIQKPEYYIDSKTWSVRPIISANKKKVVLLTFDDAPDQHSLDIAKTLKENNLHAIFFINGHFLTTQEKKDTLKKLVAMGNLLGDHTYTHPNLKALSAVNQKKEIMSVYHQIKSITGKAPKFFRAPYGVNTDTSNSLAKANHMVVMNWSYGYDFVKQYENKEALTKIMLTTPYLYNGAILLMHDRTWTAEALPGIIKGLKEKGYSFVDPNKIRTK